MIKEIFLIYLRPRSGETEPPPFVQRAREIRQRIIDRSGGGEGPDDDLMRDILPQENDEDDDHSETFGVIDEMNSRSVVTVLRHQGLEDTIRTSREESRVTESSITESTNTSTSLNVGTTPTFVRQDSSTQNLREASRMVHVAPLVSNTHDQLRHPRSIRRTRELQQGQQQQNFSSFIELMQANLAQQQIAWEREVQERRLEREERERRYEIEREENRRQQMEQRDSMMQMMMVMMHGYNNPRRRNRDEDNDYFSDTDSRRTRTDRSNN